MSGEDGDEPTKPPRPPPPAPDFCIEPLKAKDNFLLAREMNYYAATTACVVVGLTLVVMLKMKVYKKGGVMGVLFFILLGECVYTPLLMPVCGDPYANPEFYRWCSTVRLGLLFTSELFTGLLMNLLTFCIGYALAVRRKIFLSSLHICLLLIPATTMGVLVSYYLESMRTQLSEGASPLTPFIFWDMLDYFTYVRVSICAISIIGAIIIVYMLWSMRLFRCFKAVDKVKANQTKEERKQQKKKNKAHKTNYMFRIAQKLTWYPIVQVVCKVPIMSYHLGYHISFNAYVFQAPLSKQCDLQTILLFAAVVTSCFGGAAFCLIFLSAQPGAWKTIRMFLRRVLCFPYYLRTWYEIYISKPNQQDVESQAGKDGVEMSKASIGRGKAAAAAADQEKDIPDEELTEAAIERKKRNASLVGGMHFGQLASALHGMDGMHGGMHAHMDASGGQQRRGSAASNSRRGSSVLDQHSRHTSSTGPPSRRGSSRRGSVADNYDFTGDWEAGYETGVEAGEFHSYYSSGGLPYMDSDDDDLDDDTMFERMVTMREATDTQEEFLGKMTKKGITLNEVKQLDMGDLFDLVDMPSDDEREEEDTRPSDGVVRGGSVVEVSNPMRPERI